MHIDILKSAPELNAVPDKSYRHIELLGQFYYIHYWIRAQIHLFTFEPQRIQDKKTKSGKGDDDGPVYWSARWSGPSSILSIDSGFLFNI